MRIIANKVSEYIKIKIWILKLNLSQPEKGNFEQLPKIEKNYTGILKKYFRTGILQGTFHFQ